jgi:hypothetical protein
MSTNDEYVTLTDDQINEIIDGLPPVQSISPSVSKHHTTQRNVKIRNLLEEYPIPPAIFEEYKDEIIRSYYDVLIDPGTPVGGIAAGSVSAGATQTNLSAYHAVGRDSGGGSLTTMLEIYMRKKDRVFETTHIHFKDYNLSETEVREKLYSMEGITITSMLNPVEDTEIMKDVSSYSDVAPWLPAWQASTGGIAPTQDALKLFFRLKFNVLQLYTYKVLLNEIKYVLDTLEGVMCIPSPSIEGIVDIFIDYDLVRKVYDKNIPVNTLNRYDILNTYYREVVTQKFTETLNGISGYKRVTGMKNAIAHEASVLQILDGREIRQGNNWKVYGNATEVRLKGIRDEKVRGLFEVCGVKVLNSIYQHDEVSYLVTSPPSGSTPLKHVGELVQTSTDRFNDFRNKTFKSGDFDLTLDFDGGDIYRAANYYSALAQTDQLRKVLACDDVDPNITVLHNPYKMHLIYGIEAGRNMLLRLAWENIVDSGNLIAARNLHVVVESMCYKETIIPTTSKGAAKLGRETWANAAFDTPLDHIKNAAVAGKIEQVRSTSSSILFGTLIKMGTGMTEVTSDPQIPMETFARESVGRSISANPDIDLDVEENEFIRSSSNRFSAGRQSGDLINVTDVSDRMTIDFSALDLGFDGGDGDLDIPEYDEDFDVLENLFE